MKWEWIVLLLSFLLLCLKSKTVDMDMKANIIFGSDAFQYTQNLTKFVRKQGSLFNNSTKCYC